MEVDDILGYDKLVAAEKHSEQTSTSAYSALLFISV